MANIIKTTKKHFNWLQVGVYMSVLVVVIVAGYFFFRPAETGNTSGLEVPELSALQQKIAATYITASQSASNGDYAAGQKSLDDLLPQLKTNVERGDLYLRRSNLASEQYHLEDALAFAQQAEELNPTRLSATTVALAAEDSGDMVLALKYYKIVVERTTIIEQKISPDDYDYYQKKVKDLGAS